MPTQGGPCRLSAVCIGPRIGLLLFHEGPLAMPIALSRYVSTLCQCARWCAMGGGLKACFYMALAIFMGAMGSAAWAVSYDAGMAQVEYVDATSGRTLSYMLIYPAAVNAAAPVRIPMTQGLRLYQDASPLPDGVRRPLVVLSHGAGGNGSNYAWLGQYLAAHGYIVALVHHYRANTYDRSALYVRNRLWQRPRDISLGISHLLQDKDWGPRIDPDRIAVAGHSQGGFAALWLGGAQVNPEAFMRYQRGWKSNPLVPAHIRESMQVDAVPAQHLRDDRVKAVFAMAPGVIQAFGMDADGLRQTRVPVYLMVGAQDRATPADENAAFAASHIPQAELQILRGPVGHEIFTNECDSDGRDNYSESCVDAPGVDRADMHRTIGQAALTFFDSTLGVARAAAPPERVAAAQPAPDTFTAVVAAPIGGPHVAVPGTDGQLHVLYELMLTNTKRATATLQQLEVLDAASRKVLASWSGEALLGRIRTVQPAPAQAPTVPFGESRLLYVELAFPPGDVPPAVTHRLHLLAAPNPGPNAVAAPAQFTAAQINIARAPLPVLQPPLRGSGWLAVNGCCNSGIVHRGSMQGVNGGLYDSQRFAIDWMRLNPQGEMIHGDPGDVNSFINYGAEVYAVADGTVVDVLNDLDDQIPGQLPDPAAITLHTVDGNHVILDIGQGRYAFYAHLQKGSVNLRRGDQVKAGRVIGKLGNTGNSSGPHLHFHVMDSPSALGAQGMPFVFDRFMLTGQADIARFEASDELTGRWGQALPQPAPQQERFPLNLNIVDFGER
ncbi:peptidoglycan DD-metalloendopeptidase family protein [Comamonas badia]|uniref:peptidoglycan DD-metalloendopeptidase family protein n=1 Tax=Comamonas badia TaxID=265291 RepID=UPI0012ECB7AD|nr:peptidoglycan DD-metalloendopeptidase family protein [Comamonas badia]